MTEGPCEPVEVLQERRAACAARGCPSCPKCAGYINSLLVVRQEDPVSLRLCMSCIQLNDGLVKCCFFMGTPEARRHELRAGRLMTTLELK